MVLFFCEMRKTVQLISYYLLPITLLVYAYLNYEKQTFQTYGDISIWLLTVVLYIKPLSMITRVRFFKILMTYRRELGIASFWPFLAHAVGAIMIRNIGIDRLLNTQSHLFWATLAAIGMIILGVTSNDLSTKLLKRHWKTLQRIVYIVYFFALYHYTKAVDFPWLFILGGTYIFLKIFQYLKTKTI